MIQWLPTPELPKTGIVEPGRTMVDLTKFIEDHVEALRRDLIQHGALLFRSTTLAEPPDLEQFSSGWSKHLLRYIGGASPRKNVAGNVYNSTEANQTLNIQLHHEASYLRTVPALILFGCVIAPEKGGATPLAPSRTVTRTLPARIKDPFREKGITYVNHLHGGIGFGRSWQAQFESPDPAVVEEILQREGYQFKWLPDGGLVTRMSTTALQPHPVTGEELWIAQVDHWHPAGLDPKTRLELGKRMPEAHFPFNVTYGDGDPIAEEDVQTIRRTLVANRITFPWQRGDLLVCDNFLVAHGREPYEGDRRILVTLA